MKLKKLLKIMDPCTYAYIWEEKDNEEPIFEGYLIDTPWWLAKYIINEDVDEPIWISNNTEEESHKIALIINVRES